MRQKISASMIAVMVLLYASVSWSQQGAESSSEGSGSSGSSGSAEGEEASSGDSEASSSDSSSSGNETSETSSEASSASPSKPDDPSDPTLQKAISKFEAGDYQGSALLLWDYLRDAEMGTENYARAQYELARSLVKLELYQSAMLFFDEIILTGDSHPYFASAAPWVLRVSKELPGDNLMLQRLSSFASIYPDGIEAKYHDDFAYLLGQYFYKQGELERAIEYLDQVSLQSSQYNEALFLSAITDIRRYQAKPASEKLIDLMRRLEESKNNDEETMRLKRLTRITMARTFYSAGQYEDAIRYYQKIPQGSEYWLDALFESSWAYFQVDEYNRALGNLHSLNSPFFNDQYYPEAPILQAVILFYNCQFEQVRLTLDEFNYVYTPLREELEITIDSFQSDIEFFEFLRSAEVQDEQAQNFDPKLQQIVEATLKSKALQQELQLVKAIEEEQAALEEMPDSFKKSTLGSFLSGEIERIHKAAQRSGGALVRERLNSLVTELREKENQASAILVETDLAEANALSAGLSDELASDDSEAREIHVGKDEILWKFDGEYWRDELGNYYYQIASECSAGNAASE